MWAILTSKLGLAGIACALVLSLIGIQTLRLNHAKGQIASMQAAQKRAETDLRTHEQAAEQISTQARNNLSQRQAQIIVRYKTLVQKVPQYVTSKDDAACTVGTGFVSVFDAASRGETELPRPPGGSGGPPSGVSLSAVLSTTVEDFGVAQDYRAEVIAWRDWYIKQRDAWNGKP